MNTKKYSLIFQSHFTALLLLLLNEISASGSLPHPSLTGYWHNWQDASAPYIPLDQVDSRYNIIAVSFAVPEAGSTYKIQFIPDQETIPDFISQIQTVQNSGRKVLISLGGAADPVSIHTVQERDTFISRMNGILNTYGFDGLDIDLEGSSLSVTGGTIANPVDSPIILLREAILQVMQDYFQHFNRHLILTMAPETAFVQGGMSAFGGIWGAYLPLLDGLRDSLDLLQVQLYNSGTMFGVDGNIYTQGTSDFIVAMTESVILGFSTQGGFFTGLPASKIGIGLPACTQAAGGGYTDSATIRAAADYLRGVGPQPGNYQLQGSSAYPDLAGLMTWSINWDAVAGCSGYYSFATAFENIFSPLTGISFPQYAAISIYPVPAHDYLYLETGDYRDKTYCYEFIDTYGRRVKNGTCSGKRTRFDVTYLPPGIYFLKVDNQYIREIVLIR